MLPVVAAIAAAHELGVIHRDLKPENIFLTQGAYGGPCPKVVDFGISKVLGDATAMALTSTSAVFGTMYYLPPEQLAGSRDADARGDQYALGAILYECVTGRRAFEGASIYAVLRSVAEGVYAPARSWRPELPPRFEAAIDRAMSLDPAARFATVVGSARSWCSTRRRRCARCGRRSSTGPARPSGRHAAGASPRRRFRRRCRARGSRPRALARAPCC